MVTRWPYPGDSPIARARRVAQAYRSALLAAEPARCAEIDAIMASWGQAWVVPKVERFADDDWLGVADAADLVNVDPVTLRLWRSRGLLKGRTDHNGQWLYRARDLVDLAATVRRRPTRKQSGRTT